MVHEPWLDCCSEDWVSQPRSSINSLPNGTPEKTRSSYLGIQHQSRIPLAATRSNLLPSNIHTRKSPASSVLLDNAENIPISNTNTQPPSYLDDSLENGTMQVKPTKGSVRHGTPEWKRRVIRGEISAGEQCDLFGPLGLENVFKPPPTGSQSILRGFPMRNGAEHQVLLSKQANNASESNERVSDSPKNNSLKSTPGGSVRYSPAAHSIRKSSPASNFNLTGFSKDDTRLRTVSGREELRNEGISPIFLTRNSIAGAQMDYAPLDEALWQLEARLEKSPLKDERKHSSGASDDGVYYDQDDQDNPSIPNDNILEMTCQSLPEDLSMGTQELGSIGGFVNLRRGGLSNEGSFRKRALSPSSVPSQFLSSAYLSNSHIPSSPPLEPYPEYSQGSEGVPLAAPTPPQAVQTPHRSRSHNTQSSAPDKVSSGSPLKLFGNHDTFTNNKLLRRMSQFEETLPGDSDEELRSPTKSRTGGSQKTESQVHEKQRHLSKTHPEQRSTATEGRSELKNEHHIEANNGSTNGGPFPGDSFEDSFEASSSFPPLPSFSGTPKKAADRSHFQHNSRTVSGKKHPSTGNRAYRQAHPTTGVQKRAYAHNQDSLVINTSDAKRMLNTPAKDSTPKRRRTLQRAALPNAAQKKHLDLTAESTAALSFVTGQEQTGASKARGRKQSPTDSSKLPQEQRPRTPSPGRKRSSRAQTHSQKSQSINDREGKNNTDYTQTIISDDISIPNHVATGVRKGSITTQDFLDEATKIMSIIRAKGRPKSALESVDESGLESQTNSDYISSVEESSQEEFSRPPSRDGVDIRKARVQPKQNPRIVSHLRKYQEKDDMDLLMSASLMSLRLDRKPKPAQDEEADQAQNEEDAVESSPKNIRIRENISRQRKRKLTGGSATEDQGTTSMNTRSSRSSSTKSIPTGSSNGSGTKGIISSNMISHLIPEQIGGMTYDRTNHTWIKGQSDEEAARARSKSRLSTSEADPFEDIPDLSVDELQELIRSRKLGGRTSDGAISGEMEMPADGHSNGGDRPATRPQSSDSRPRTRDGNPPLPFDTSSVQSKASHFNFSGPKPETRATSWGTEDLDAKHHAAPGSHPVQAPETVDEQPNSPSPTPSRIDGTEKLPAATIAFSSPIASRIEYEDDSIITEHRHRPTNADYGSRYDNRFSTSDAQSTHDSHNPSVKTLPRHTSFDGRPFTRRPISRIDELNEESIHRELSVMRRDDQQSAMSMPQKNELSIAHPPNPDPDTSYSFNLTTLADFTVNQVDQPLQLEVSYIAQRTHPTSLRQVHGTFALATEELVKHITDVEPYEPYWDHVRQLDLRSKKLITLHRLSDFCPRLEELDVSNNDIGQLSGAPSSIRSLRIQHNSLSSLTAWGHLSNLQYIDVSGNDLENLDGFSSLVHLRELKANDNKIENINGVFGLNGLLSLRLKGNMLSSVDFEGAELDRLCDMDLSDNQLKSVQNLPHLRALERLDLSDNDLQTLDLSAPHQGLHALKLSDNHIESLDLSAFPSLQLLYLDRNHFSTLAGLEKCRHLDTLSVREQASPPSLDRQPDHVLDVDLPSATSLRKLYLSSNTLSSGTLSSPTAVPSLQLFDLASCAIQALPAQFGTKFPNLRALNLNFNALSDVGELLGISRLSRLTLVGNRVARLRRLCQVLNRVGGHAGFLKKIDLRGNPVTVGFYPPAVSGSGRTLPRQPKRIGHNRDNERGQDGHLAITNMGHCADIAYQGAGVVDRVENRKVERRPENGLDGDEIDDPYTLPAADVEADKKYIAHLDESTKLRRRVVELMISSATAGRVKLLDGLPLICEGGDGGEDNNDMVLKRLKELQIFRKKGVNEEEEEL
ncbi:hypothetical protein FQN54_006741 [Arachnomyces sp. PD_36]|nr:hypothetical protein FQN54_006741 [Arachnomyces sp. PD_36]